MKRRNPQSRTERINAAIIGCGRMGYEFSTRKRSQTLSSHFEGYTNNPRIEVVAVADNDPTKRAKIREKNVRVYADYRKMLDNERLDILSVCTPAASHAEICINAASRVKVILCEKPIATSLLDANKMIAACRKHQTILAINHSRRWAAEFAQARAHVPDIGNTTSLTARCNVGLMNSGTHLIDALRYLFGDVVEVRGRLALDGNDDPGGRGELRFSAGCVAHVECAGYNHKSFEISAHGSMGVLRWDETTNTGLTIYTEDRRPKPAVSTLKAAKDSHPDFADATRRAVENLVECFEGKAYPACDGVDGYKAVEVAVAWHVSNMTDGAWVALPLKKHKSLNIVPRQTSFTKSGRL